MIITHKKLSKSHISKYFIKEDTIKGFCTKKNVEVYELIFLIFFFYLFPHIKSSYLQCSYPSIPRYIGNSAIHTHTHKHIYIHTHTHTHTHTHIHTHIDCFQFL